MKLMIFVVMIIVGGPVLADQCEYLGSEYARYDSDRLRFEVSGILDDSAIRAENRLSAVQIILQRQAMVLDMIIASECPLPDPPRPFSATGIMCQGSPQACRE